MSTLNTRRTPSYVRSQVATHEGGIGRKAGAEEELALLALTTFLGDKFYETSATSLDRMYRLVQKLVPEYVTQLARVARQEFNMRATPAALIGFHLLAYGQPEDGRVYNDVFFRGDEIGDTLAVVSRFSDKRKVIPSAVRFARSVVHHGLTQRKALRYANSNKEWSLEKIIRLSHARQDASPEQIALYNFILHRHSAGSLSAAWEALSDEERAHLGYIEAVVRGEDEGEAGWERARSAGAAWSEIVPNMGYMALLRNLRNLMQDESLAGDRQFWNDVSARISSPDEVRKSRQLPFRFYSALRHLPAGHRYHGLVAQAVSDALDASIGNLPRLEGRTLVVVDVSGSMTFSRVSGQSEVSPSDIANLFGAAMFQSQDADVIAFATTAQRVKLERQNSIVTNIREIERLPLGSGTSIRSAFDVAGPRLKEYNNVVVFSDFQIRDEVRSSLGSYQGNVFAVNLAAYEAQMEAVGKRFYSIGGWSDATLKLMSTLVSGSLVDYIRNY